MAPVTTQTMESLQETIAKLESRVNQLEAKLQAKGGDTSTPFLSRTKDSIRIILMGPPGAGL